MAKGMNALRKGDFDPVNKYTQRGHNLYFCNEELSSEIWLNKKNLGRSPNFSLVNL